MITPKISVNAQTASYGIFGNPVRHSLSPFLHNTLFGELGINAVYTAYEVDEPSLGLAFEAVRALGLKGVNLTIPHKEAAMNFVDEVPEDIDRCIGALNTVVNKGGLLYGYNTDAKGFLIALHEELSFNPAGKRVLVMGAGGAARGVVFALAQAHADKIWIYNRTLERAEGLAEYLAEYFPETEIAPLGAFDSLEREKIDLIVNATSCGMKPAEVAPVDLARFRGKPAVYDLIYAPAETKLLKQAKALSLPHANGLGMLAAQAALAFELWTGKKEGVRERMLELLKKC